MWVLWCFGLVVFFVGCGVCWWFVCLVFCLFVVLVRLCGFVGVFFCFFWLFVVFVFLLVCTGGVFGCIGVVVCFGFVGFCF